MAPIPELVAQKVTAPDPTFTEMVAFLVVFGHICVFCIALWWLETSSVSGKSHLRVSAIISVVLLD